MLCHELWVFYDWSSNKHCYHFKTPLLSPPPSHTSYNVETQDKLQILVLNFGWLGERFWARLVAVARYCLFGTSQKAPQVLICPKHLSMIVVIPVLHRERASKVDTVFVICPENHTMWLQVNHQPEMRCYTPLLSDPPKIEIQNIKIFMKYFNKNKWKLVKHT